MPKIPAPPEVVSSIRENIIMEAAALINEVGYSDFSMRRLGSRLGVAAKTIYNYFTDKDELYLLIVTKGFEILFYRFQEAYSATDDPFARLRAMARAYIDYGIENPHLYSIMFSMGTPKYADYVGTRHEKLAESQNLTALRSAELAERVLREIANRGPGTGAEDANYRLMYVWSTLHGIVSLSLSRVTLEVGDFSRYIDRMIDDTLECYRTEGDRPSRTTP